MDKELLRVVIIATGLLVIVGMLAWHFLKNKNQEKSFGRDQKTDLKEFSNLKKSTQFVFQAFWTSNRSY